jgi:hypothetical protein
MTVSSTGGGAMSDSKREKIAARAYEIWVEEGYPDGKEQEHWLRAEQELAGQDSAEQMGGETAPDPTLDTRPAPPVNAAPQLDDSQDRAAGAGAAPAKKTPTRAATTRRARTPRQEG